MVLSVVELSNLPGNSECADCRRPSVDYASYNLGVFLCTTCVSVHRMMGTHISQTKHIKLGSWSDPTELSYLAETGNIAVNAEYEKHIPDCYRRPDENSPPVLLEQFIRAKYERLEFVHTERQEAYTASSKTGHLFKRGRDSPKFEIRMFQLSEAQSTLSYFIKAGRDPKLVMQLQWLNVAFVPEKVNHPNGMQITYVHDGSVRHIYVYHNDGQTVVDWYMAIRNAKLNHLLVAFPGSSVAELSAGLTRDFLMEGWLSKVGPRAGDPYRKRWFTLDGRKLMYHDAPLDPVPKGVIPIGERGDRSEAYYDVRLNVPPGSKDQGFSFTLRTPERTYLLSAAHQQDRAGWMEVLQQLLRQPLTPQERALAAGLRFRQASSRRLSRSTSDVHGDFPSAEHDPAAPDSPGRSHVTRATRNSTGHVTFGAMARRALLARALSKSAGNILPFR